MCTHQRTVYNRFVRTSFYVPCGKCEACLQQKAYRRASRIKSEVSPDKICLFVTLTYDRYSCPYVLQKDIDEHKDVLPVYREFTTRRVRSKRPYGVAYLDKRVFSPIVLGEIYFPNYDSFMYRKSIRHLKYRERHVGVCYFPDVQLFKKRLNINLKRIYNYEKEYKVFSTMEYGETTSRPHAHLLFFIPPCDEALFRTAISQAWPFADKSRTEKYIELAKGDMANYVASYVNSGSHLHGFLSSNFKPKHSYSKDFGMSDKLFSLDSILEKIERRDLSYLRGIGQKGNETYINLSIPKYVINRYFPLFKGYSRFTDVEILDILRFFIQPSFRIIYNCPKTPLISFDKLSDIDYTKEDLHRISVRLTNAFERYSKLRGLKYPNIEEYISHFVEAWKVYRNTCMRLWYEDTDVPLKYKYDNSYRLFDGTIYSPDTKECFDKTSEKYICDPNEYPSTVDRSVKYASIFNFRCKERKVNNFVMAQNNYYF